MTIASKSRLVAMRCVRAGAPFADVTTKTSIDTTDISAFINKGNTFFGVSDEEALSFPSSTSPTKRGAPFNEVTAKSTYDASFGQGRTRQGTPFTVRYTGTSVFPAVIPNPVLRGAPFRDITTKSTIDASEFDITRRGGPFWVTFTGGVEPPTFDTSRFFIFF